MKISLIAKLFDGKIDIDFFKTEIQGEVSYFKSRLIEKGRSLTMNIDDDTLLYINANNLIYLCNAYLSGILDKWELSFTSEVIDFCESKDFENEKVQTLFESLLDPEFLKIVDNKLIQQIIFELHQ